MNYLKLLLLLVFICSSYVTKAEQKLSLTRCKKLEPNPIQNIDTENTESLFWKIEKKGYETSYLYGTIHASDPRVLDIPNNVLNAIEDSKQFILESLFTPELEINLSKRMFSSDEYLLNEYVAEDVIFKINQILSFHNIPQKYIKLMQPWAAYLIMNYPEKSGTILDLKLLDIARQQNKQLKGLETLDQQLAVFDSLNYLEQTLLLFDSVCHYQTIQHDLNNMIEYYVNKDVRNLINSSNKYSLVNDKIYQDLYEQLVIVRNQDMTKNIIKNLKTTSNFIAIGSLHLVGQKGVVAILKQQGYKLTPIH